ncbi:MAG: GatB/YqeY domain-containing protein [Thioalkalivibrionaceae bacterium]
MLDDIKAAMRAKDRDRLGVLRMLSSEVKQIEVDERIEVDDARFLALVQKMIKQRRDAEQQFRDGGREDLAERERSEIVILESYLPEPLSEVEIDRAIDAAVVAQGATSMRDMGAVMAVLREQLAGRADMAAVSQRVKTRLAG